MRESHPAGTVEIQLSQGFVALVDSSDFDEFEALRKYKWHILRTKSRIYARAHIKYSTVLMHRLIMEPLADQVVDHINLNGLDNRRLNLRIATPTQNNANSNKRNGCYTSKFKGVYWHRDKRKWRAQIQINRQAVHLGYFGNEVDAALAYDERARQVFGAYAKTNF